MAEVFTHTYKPPVWLNENFIQVALREGLRRESINVNALNIKPATNVGDNYLSQMFRASASIESKRKGKEDLSLIIKSLPVGEEVEKFMNEGKFFTRETDMLLYTLPTMQNNLDKVEEQKICAKLYFQQGEPDNIIILEDLCLNGYKSTDRLKCLDLAHCLLVAESIAVFHAASLVTIKNDPKLKETYSEIYWQEQNDATITKFWDESISTLLECLDVWKTLPPIYKEKLEKLRETVKSKLYKATMRNENELNVLNHGDPWTSNFMFQYSNGILSNCVFVDFQLSCYNTVVYDLLYFIFTSPRNEVRLNHLNDILRAYHNKLVATCKKLNYPLKMSFGDLREAFFSRLFFGFYTTMVLLPFMIVPSKDATDLNDFLATKDHSNKMIDNIFYKEAIESVFPFFLENGIFD